MRVIVKRVRDLFIRASLRNVHFSDNYWKLRTLYATENPWNLDQPGERHRYEETNRVIAEHVGQVGTLLEIGCGEGHQTDYLLKVSESVTGVDVSPAAIRRAQRRCPGSEFRIAEDLQQIVEERNDHRYTVVTACEVLYYMGDVGKTIAQMNALGDWCVVTYYGARAERLDPYFEEIPGVISGDICHGDCTWKLKCWKND